MNEQEQLIGKVCDDVRDLLIRKNRDYGGSFSKQYERYGVMCALIRMDDKMERLRNLVSGAKQEIPDESIDDTLQDLMGYCALTIVERLKNK